VGIHAHGRHRRIRKCWCAESVYTFLANAHDVHPFSVVHVWRAQNSQEAEQTGVEDADDCDMDLDTADFGDDSMLDSGDDENDEVNGHRRRGHGVPSTGPRLPSAAMSPPRTGGHNSRQQAALLAKRRRRQAAKARISPDMLKRAHSGILVTPGYLHKQSSSSDLLQGLTSAERAQLRNTSSRVMQQKRTASRAVGTRPFPTRDSPSGQSKRAHIVSAPVQLRSQQRAAAGIVPGVVGCSDSSPTAVSAAGQAAIIHDLQKIKSELAYLQFLQCQSLQGSLTREQAQEFTANSAKARQLQQKQEAMQSARNAKLSERGASAGPRYAPTSVFAHLFSRCCVAPCALRASQHR